MSNGSARHLKLPFALQEESFRTADILKFLLRLLVLYKRELVIVLDNYTAHHSTASVYRWLRSYLPRHWKPLRFAFLPAYAPELNPIEPVWGEVKQVDLSSRWFDSLSEMRKVISRGLQRIRQNTNRLRAYIGHAGWLDD